MADMKKADAGAKTGWAKLWGNFEEKHPKLAKWLYQIFYFFVFSMGVTIIQYLFFTFMPGILGEGLAIWIFSAWNLRGACWDIMCSTTRREPC